MKPEFTVDNVYGLPYGSDVMATVKQKFEQAAIELAHAKLAFAEARKTLTEAEAKWNAVYRKAVGGGKSKSGKVDDIPSGVTEQIVALLKTDIHRDWSYADIQDKLPGVRPASLRALLFKLQKEGQAKKVGRGLWRANSLDLY
jgi:hypothetical protein